jgi:hypothetical protein
MQSLEVRLPSKVCLMLLAAIAPSGCGRLGFESLFIDRERDADVHTLDASSDANTSADANTITDAATTIDAAHADADTLDADTVVDANTAVDASTIIDASTAVDAAMIDSGAPDAACALGDGPTEFERRMALAFPADIHDWNKNAGGVCSDLPCNGIDFVCNSGDCGMMASGAIVPNSGVCGSGATCRIHGLGNGFDFVNPMVCEAGSTCYISAYNGRITGPVVCRAGATCSFVGEQGILDGVTCEAGSDCFFNCFNGMCHNVVVETDVRALFDCEISYCDVTCPVGATCIADCTSTADSACPACQPGASCACFSGGGAPCATLCSGPAPCATTSAPELLTACWGF